MKHFIYVERDHDPLWRCTVNQPRVECQGQVLGIRLFEDDGTITPNGNGVCQAFAHRAAMVDRLQGEGYRWSPDRQADADGTTTSEQNFLHSRIYPPIEPSERTTMNLDQSDLQRRLYEYLHGRGSYREQALSELEEAGAFRDGQSDEVTQAIIRDYYESSGLRGLFCDNGRERFHSAFLSTAEGESEPVRVVSYAYIEPVRQPWGCTEASSTEQCSGGNSQIRLIRSDGTVDDTQLGVCQWIDHRVRQGDALRNTYPELRFDNDACTGPHQNLITNRPSEESAMTITETLTTPFFNDQRTTLTAEDIRNHPGIDAGQRFVTVEALVDAIREYKAEYDLCDPGTTAFLDEFGLSLVRTFETEITLGNGGPVIARFRWTGTDEGDVQNLSLGGLDSTLNSALDSELEANLTDVEVINGFDCYLGETRALED